MILIYQDKYQPLIFKIYFKINIRYWILHKNAHKQETEIYIIGASMASTSIAVFQKTLSLSIHSSKCCKNRNPSLEISQFLAPISLLKLKKQTRHLSTPTKHLKNAKIHVSPIISAAQSNLFKGTLKFFLCFQKI